MLKYLFVFKGGIFMLNEYENNKVDTISKLVSKEITVKEAMELLNLTERQIYITD